VAIKVTNHTVLILCSLFLLVSTPNRSFSFSAKEHNKDFEQVLPFFSNSQLSPEGKALKKSLFKSIAEMTDGYSQYLKPAIEKQFTTDTIIGRLARRGKLPQQFSHRIFFHWGAGGRIPWNHPPLSDYLRKLEKAGASKEEIKKFKEIVAEQWKILRNKSIKASENFVKYIGLPQYMAKPIASLTYDIHILGDHTGTHTEALAHIENTKRDIVKQVGKLLKLDKKTLGEFERKLSNLNSTDAKVYAERLKIFLKNEITALIERNKNLSPATKKLCKVVLGSALSASTLINLMKKVDSTFNRIPNANLRQSVKTGAFFGLVAAGWNIYKCSTGQIEALEALRNTIQVTTSTTTSMYIANAVIQKLPEVAATQGEKFAITAICKTGAAQMGLATFIYSETDSVFNLIQGDISLNQFNRETTNNLIGGVATGVASHCAVLLGATPGGIVVLAVVVVSQIAINYGVTQFRKYQQKDYLFVADILPFLPASIQQRETYWNPKPRDTYFTPKPRDTYFTPKPRDTYFTPKPRDTYFTPRPR